MKAVLSRAWPSRGLGGVLLPSFYPSNWEPGGPPTWHQPQAALLGQQLLFAREQLLAFSRGRRQPQCDDADLLLSAEGGEAAAAVDHLSSPATPRPPPLASPTVPSTGRVLSPRVQPPLDSL